MGGGGGGVRGERDEENVDVHAFKRVLLDNFIGYGWVQGKKPFYAFELDITYAGCR